jgi:adenylate cyclase class 2
MEEFEIKFLEIDVPELEKKFVEIGAEKVGEYDYTRVIMDYSNFSLHENHSWIRLRTDGKETTLTYKQAMVSKSGDRFVGHVGMKEIEVGVEDYMKTLQLLKAIGLMVKTEEKNRRIRYKKENVIFDIDFWPQIPTYLEIESDSYEKVKNSAQELGFNPENGIIGTAGTVYKHYGINIDDYSSITFEGMIKK